MRFGLLGGTELRVHPLLLPVLAAACVLGKLNALLAALLAIVLHETSHAILCYAFGVRVYALELMPFGAVARVDRQGMMGQAELCIAAAGPVTSLVIAGCTAMCADLFPRTMPLLRTFMTYNIVLAAVNLLPALPLDGGRVLRTLLQKRMTLHTSSVLLSGLGILFGTGFLTLTVCCALREIYNLTFPTMGLFLIVAGIRELRLLPETEVRAYVRRLDALQRGEGCQVRLLLAHASMPASEAVRLLERDSFNVLRVVDEKMRLLGELDESALLRGVAVYGGERSVGELLTFDREG